MKEGQREVASGFGVIDTFVCHPERGDAPVVLIYMDAYGIREELRDLARRLATAGYYVMLPNLYYRMGVKELGPIPEPDDQRRIGRLTACVQSLNIPDVMADTESLLAHAADDPAADASRVGTLGYCMSGRFAVGAAARFSSVQAAISIYGTWLVSDDPESPHRSARHADAAIYFACAEHDHWAPLETIDTLRTELADASDVEIEVYPGVEHGFAFKTRHAYDRAADDRHWERIHGLFRRTIG